MSISLIHRNASGWFPFYPVEVTDPTEVGDYTLYPVGMSLEKVCDLYWRYADFKISATASATSTRSGFAYRFLPDPPDNSPGTAIANGGTITDSIQPAMMSIKNDLLTPPYSYPAPTATPPMQQLTSNWYYTTGFATDSSGSASSPPTIYQPDGYTGSATVVAAFTLFPNYLGPPGGGIAAPIPVKKYGGLYYPFFAAYLSVGGDFGVGGVLNAVAEFYSNPSATTPSFTINGTLYGETFKMAAYSQEPDNDTMTGSLAIEPNTLRV